MDIEDFLSRHNVIFERFDHKAVFTCEEAEAELPHVPGAHTKSLFLRDKKGKKHFLVIVCYEKDSVDLKSLGNLLGSHVSFASPERLQKYLGVEPGSVTLLGLVNDTEKTVNVFIDEELWRSDSFQFHPLVNTATLVIPKEGIEKFLEATGHSFSIISVPSAGSPTSS